MSQGNAEAETTTAAGKEQPKRLTRAAAVAGEAKVSFGPPLRAKKRRSAAAAVSEDDALESAPYPTAAGAGEEEEGGPLAATPTSAPSGSQVKRRRVSSAEAAAAAAAKSAAAAPAAATAPAAAAAHAPVLAEATAQAALEPLPDDDGDDGDDGDDEGTGFAIRPATAAELAAAKGAAEAAAGAVAAKQAAAKAAAAAKAEAAERPTAWLDQAAAAGAAGAVALPSPVAHYYVQSNLRGEGTVPDMAAAGAGEVVDFTVNKSGRHSHFVGKFISDFRSERQLGVGGYGEVLLGTAVVNGEGPYVRLVRKRIKADPGQGLDEKLLLKMCLNSGSIWLYLNSKVPGAAVELMGARYIPSRAKEAAAVDYYMEYSGEEAVSLDKDMGFWVPTAAGSGSPGLVRPSSGPKRLSWVRVRARMRSICTGLRGIHEVGVVHRDVKPANLLLTDGPDGDEVSRGNEWA
jgi:hypothetical protein